MKDGTPLPAALSGNIIERLIRLDESLMFLIGGALQYVCDREYLEQTGTLTIDDTRILLSDMLWTFYTENPAMTPVGTTLLWHMPTPPDRWLICEGAGHSTALYPELFALWGYKYGGSGAFFAVPDMSGRIPWGASISIPLDDEYGAATHTLTISEMPSHNHQLQRGSQTAGGTTPRIVMPNNTTFGPLPVTGGEGGGNPHNNIPPVLGVHFIVYAGKP